MRSWEVWTSIRMRLKGVGSGASESSSGTLPSWKTPATTGMALILTVKVTVIVMVSAEERNRWGLTCGPLKDGSATDIKPS